jgi:mannose-1-phosphate guanylyltransferase
VPAPCRTLPSRSKPSTPEQFAHGTWPGISLHVARQATFYDPHVWNVVLAGGEGTRLQDYVARRFGRAIPKQYCTFTGTRSMLEHTADRAHRFAPPARTVAVIGEHHRALALPQLEGRADHVMWQPCARDTGPGLFFPLAYIMRWDPGAVFSLFPADHFIAPEGRFTEVVASALRVARMWPDRVVTLGVTPDDPDPDYGYITLGTGIAGAPGLRRVTGFVEKPSLARAGELCARGALWNTMITCATVQGIWDLARETQPEMMELFDAFVPLIDTPEEHEAIQVLFEQVGNINLSRDMLEHAPERLLALPLDGVEWSDWGRPERIEETLAARTPARPRAPETSAFAVHAPR